MTRASPTPRVEIDPPPQIADDEGAGGAVAGALPMLGSLGSMVVVAAMGSAGSGGRTRSLVLAAMFLVTTVGFVVVQLDRQRGRRVRALATERRRYLRHLAAVRTTVREAAARQRTDLLARHPDPVTLSALAEERSRVWERAEDEAAFLQVRYATCPQPLALELVPPDLTGLDRVDPASAFALRGLLAVHRLQPGLPALADLHRHDRVQVTGHPESRRSLARALVCSAAMFHSPRHLAVAVLVAPETEEAWDWVKWLPHALSPQRSDAVGPRRMVATDPAELATLLRTGTTPHLLLVVDTDDPPPPSPGATLLALGESEPSGGSLRLELRDSAGRPVRLVSDAAAGTTIRATPDSCDALTAEALARRLAACAAGPAPVEQHDVLSSWRRRPSDTLLRVAIGLGEDGQPLHLDLKQSAEHGMGPHGLVVGATGSGKSELLRTLVLGLASTHSPDQLALVLVDFKGGATFAGMSALPHVAASITNLEQELGLVDRLQDALTGELVRRQELLRDAGGYASARDHERARAAGADLEPLPSLLVVVDEFSELLEARPEFAELFAALGRLGRSLGVHLLLATQRLDEGRLRGLESHLSYRIGLRTFSAQESRAALGVPDAHDLPSRPGVGYLRSGPQTLLRFEAFYVSGPATPPEGTGRPVALPWTAAEVSAPPLAGAVAPDPGRESLLDVVVAALAAQGPHARRIWLPPLGQAGRVGDLMADLAPDPHLGLVSQQWRRRGHLTLPIGTVDRPREQRQDTYSVSLAGADGHVAVVGGPRSGKSTLLRTLVSGMALTTTARESQVYLLDLGGGGWSALRRLPHVAGLATRAEPDVVRRAVAEVATFLDRREAYFGAAGIDSVETYRSRRAEGTADDGHGDVFLVVDGWGTLRADFDDLEHELQQLASRGLPFGLHLLTATLRWADYRAAMRDLLGTRLELRLGDPLDSELDRRLAQQVPAGRPGRGLIPTGHHFLGALPLVDVDRVVAAWPGPPAPPLRMLPGRLSAADLLTQAGRTASTDGPLLIGVDERALEPVGLDPDAEPHWLVLGDGGSGKTAALRGYVHEVLRTRTPAQAQLVVVDYRRSLLGEVPDDHLLGHHASPARATAALAELATYLQSRIPGDGVTPEQLRRRSWWSGAEVFVVVDDYDLVATTEGSPVRVLLPLLAQARDVGLHLVLARRSGGASRSLYEPVLQGLRDVATPGLVLSGSPDEGPLIGGVRATPGPPGRGRLVTRDRGVQLVQLAWRDPRG
ncbi:MAG: type VII secretion protein EccCb [Nocardioides sp.]